MATVIRFGELPAPKEPGRKLRYASLVEELEARPGDWALIDDNAPSRQLAKYLRDRYPLETASRLDDNGQVQIWARWTPETQEDHDARTGKADTK